MAKATTAAKGSNVPAKAAEANTSVALSDDLRNVPAWMQEDLDKGKENIGSEDIELPRLKLIQGLSPELEQYNDLRPGHFLHTAHEHIFTGPFRAVPIYMDRRYILWNPRDSGGGILARADDGIHWNPPNIEFSVKLDKKDGGHTVKWKTATTVKASGLADWGTMNPNDPQSPPAATLMFNFLLAFPDNPDLMPAVLTFQRSTVKMGRRLNTKLKTTRIPSFGLVFEFNSFKDSNSSGQEFHSIDARGAGRIDDEAQYRMYKNLYETIAKTGIAIKDLEGMQDEATNGPDGGGDDAEDNGKPAF